MLRRFITRLAISLAALLITLIAAVIALVYFAYALFLVLLNVVVPPAAAIHVSTLYAGAWATDALNVAWSALAGTLLVIAVLRIMPWQHPRKSKSFKS